MSIRFAAVHERNSWRTHSQHTSLVAATTGRDGAENLLLNRQRAPDRKADFGPVHAVFVWADDQADAMAFRLKPGSDSDIERVLVPMALLAPFKRSAGPSLAQIGQWFMAAQLGDTSRPQCDASLQVPSSFAALLSPEETDACRYRYGSKRTWELVYEAVRACRRPVSVGEVGNLIAANLPHFKRNNLAPHLSMLSVNCFSRGNHAVNRTPRRTDGDNPYDKLIRLGEGRNVCFALYDPQVHGVWELVDVGAKVLRPRFVEAADAAELEQARNAVAAVGLFDPTEDARQRILMAVVRRDGQPAFRRLLLAAYGSACAISGCAVEELLEAAHILPYRGVQTNVVVNGLLLRADLHKLFDLHLLGIDPITRKVCLSAALRQSEYAKFHGAPLRMPRDPGQAPLAELLAHHQERCGWMHAGEMTTHSTNSAGLPHHLAMPR